jgi:hypothetical protein
MTSRHPFTIGRTVLLVAVTSAVLVRLWVAGGEGDGTVILPLLALPVGAYVGYFIGLALNRGRP